MKQPSLKKLWPAFALVAILILGITLRIQGIDQRDYWYDEAFTGVTVRQELPKMMEIIVGDVHPPMYYWMLKSWTMVAGDGIVALRLFSVIFGIGTVILAFIALRMWYKKSWLPATLGAFVFAINPFLANYSQEARMYTLLGFLILLTAIFISKARTTKHWGWQLAYGITAAFVLLTHYLGFIFMIGFGLYDFWQEYKEKPNLKKWKNHISWLLYSYLVPFIAGLAWIPSFLKQTSRQNTLGWVPNAPLTDIPLSFHKFLFGSPVGVPGVPPALGYRVEWLSVTSITLLLTILLTVLMTYVTIKKKWSTRLSFLAFMTFLPLLLTWALQFVEMQLYVERFLSGTAIFSMLFFIASMFEIEKKQGLIAAVAVYTFLVAMIQPWQHNQSFEELSGIASQRLGQQQIIFSSPFDFTVGRFYLGEDARSSLKLYNVNNVQEDLSDWAIIDNGDQIFELPQDSHLLITPQPQDFNDYQELLRVNQFAVLEK